MALSTAWRRTPTTRCCAAEHDLMWEIWELSGGIGNPDAHRAMADLIRQTREGDERTAGDIEQALAP